LFRAGDAAEDGVVGGCEAVLNIEGVQVWCVTKASKIVSTTGSAPTVQVVGREPVPEIG